MFKLLLMLLSAAAGAAAAIGYLLGYPNGLNAASLPPGSPLETVKAQLDTALAEGKQRGSETEEQLRRELAAYRRGATGA